MKNFWKKFFFNWVIPIAVSTLFVMTLEVSINGMYLPGVPEPEDVEKVIIAYPAMAETAHEYTDPESIDLAVHLTGFLKYSLFERSAETEPSKISITYILRDGRTLTAAANEETVWWRGKAHAIKEKGSFIKLTTGIFFFEDAAGN